jgi:hypothetical protein
MATRSDAQKHVARAERRLGRDGGAEANLLQGAETIEAIASKLTTVQLHRAFVTAEPIAKIFQALGRQAPGSRPWYSMRRQCFDVNGLASCP